MPAVTVAALYRFVNFPDFRDHQQPLRDRMNRLGIRGTLLLASEGINGTVAGTADAIDALLTHLRSDPRLAALDAKLSIADDTPFRKARVRLKREIVTLGVPDIDPTRSVGTYVDPHDWNALLDDPDLTLIDTRNDYEVALGSFRGAINPQTPTFRDFPAFVAEKLDPATHKKVAMFCTGGIRCEKSTAYLKSKGFDQVYHLRGGILNYLEKTDENDSKWQGECFVFDRRVSVNHRLEPGTHALCHACGWPVPPADLGQPTYIKGISCPRCHGHHTPDQIARFTQRQRQLESAQSP